MSEEARPIPYPPIERHGLVGDRRSAALVCADGTIDWFCAPRYDSLPAFAALLDVRRGGHFRFAPAARTFGVQRYPSLAPILETRFDLPHACLSLTDAMIDPEYPRDSGEGRRTIVRRLASSADGTARVSCIFDLSIRDDARARTRIWSTHTPAAEGTHAFTLAPGEEAWAILAFDDERDWTIARAKTAIEAAQRWWIERCERFTFEGPRRARLLRSLVTIELLGDASTGASVAAPTTSLPERIGGTWNCDYRLAWVRDGSLSAATLALAGDERAAQRYLEWLAGLSSSTDAPLQVVYATDGSLRPKMEEMDEYEGYRRSRPVRFGNHAYEQKQLGVFGFFADCASVYRRHGGPWRDSYYELLARCSDYVRTHWTEEDNGIWELPKRRHHTSSAAMGWLALDRAARIADEVGRHDDAHRWRTDMHAIAEKVKKAGWSERRRSFVHAFERDAMDASVLLLPITRLIAPDDPRARATIEAVERELVMNGWVHRFVPTDIEGVDPYAMGDMEGSFVLCTAWLASAWAVVGEPDRAASLIERIEAAAGDLGLLPEGIDARTGTFRGNHPLLFSHAEYVRAVVELEKARPERARAG